MTTQDYFEALVGQYLEVAGTSAQNQCVDSVNFYIKFILRLLPIEYTNARDFPSKAGDKYEWIPNGDANFPIEGDIVIWGGNVWGHTGVCIEGDVKRFKSFDQNWPTGSACRAVDHTYLSPLPVLGWLRPKVKPTEGNQALIDQLRAERDTNWNLYIKTNERVIELEELLRQKNSANEAFSIKVESLTDEIKGYSESLQTLQTTNMELIRDNTELKKDKQKVEMDLSICLAQRKDIAKWTSPELKTELRTRKDVSFLTKLFL